MARNDSGRGSGGSPVRSTLVLVLFLALVAGGVAVWRYDLVDRLRDGDDAPQAGPTSDPAVVAPPPGVVVPDVVAPPPVAVASAPTTALGPAAVRRALNTYLRDKRLGRHVLAEVAPLDGDGPAVTVGGGADTAIPASTTKLVTSTAALLALGPDHVFTTEVRRRGNVVTLVGGGDPFLERGPLDQGQPWPYPVRADLQDLARQTAAALQADGVRRVRLDYD
ncbi:D-alanyl-D-alanine carboxypeptidase, partial [Nocardioides sp.]|uniref:D-alanyl-D-alanine carboxypeptidase n=1 Tax=Nocardioides sp. TaxID=35761 RepID=UPI002726801F